MHKIIKIILRVLDGAPPPDRQKQSGQSLLEMAFITPLLLIMFMGVVEIGWYANHYMILLEVTRVGARAGTVLTGDLGPLSWVEQATIHPIVYEFDDTLGWANPADGLGSMPPQAVNYRSCAPGTPFGFYNFIACSMIDSLAPLTIKGRDPATTEVVERIIRNRSGGEIARIPIPDDIVISLFSLAAINNASLATVNPADYPDEKRYVDVYSRTFNFNAITDEYEDGFQVIVTGRYPASANECNVYYDEDTAPPLAWYGDERDPFDFIPDGIRNQAVVAGRVVPLEQAGYDEGPELQRGFVWTGQHRVRDIVDADGREIVCWGSEFTSEDVQRLMNSPNFIELPLPAEPLLEDYADASAWSSAHAIWQANVASIVSTEQERMSFLPSQGLILVEMYWMHNLLLNFPLLSPAVQMFGDPNNIVINVWAAFPVPAVEPNIIFGLP